MPRTIDCIVISSADRTKLRTLQLDASTLALTIVDYPHHEVHDGRSFKLYARSLNLSTTPLQFYFTTPTVAVTERRLHLVEIAWSGGEAEFVALRGCTVSGGVATAPKNRRHDSPNNSIILGNCFVGGNAPTGGEEFSGEYLGQSGAGNSSTSAGRSRGDCTAALSRPFRETTYSFRLTGGAYRGNLFLGWYEHADKEK